jgi:hypothetical protein
MSENIRVSKRTKAELEKLKGDTGADSFNEVLERELGIIPNPDNLDNLTADLHSGIHQTVEELIETIRSIEDFDERVEEETHQNGLTLVFTDPESGYDVAKVEFRYPDNAFVYRYRDVKSEWKRGANGEYRKRHEEVRLSDRGGATYEDVGMDDVKERVKETVNGSLQRWRE